MALEISPQQTRIGWIGTGVMGRSMCGHLLSAGYKVTLFNRTKAKAAELLDRGADLIVRFGRRGAKRVLVVLDRFAGLALMRGQRGEELEAALRDVVADV